MRKLLVLLVTAVAFVTAGSAAEAQPEPDYASLLADGRYTEGPTDANDDAAISRANNNGVAVLWLNRTPFSDSEAPTLAVQLRADLQANSSGFTDVFVLIDDGSSGTLGLGAASRAASNEQINTAIQASAQLFLAGDFAGGLDTYLSTVGNSAPQTPSNSSQASASQNTGGFGLFGWILLVAFLGGGCFVLFRVVSGRRRTKKQAVTDLAADRAEIQEQLRNNADRVIDLGDKVILANDDELLRLYEQASASYQEVSTSVGSATTAEDVDQLDEKIDTAEWQFDVIEAKLAGNPAPPSPAEIEAKEQQDHKANQGRGPQDRASSNKPALGRDETLFPGGGRTRHSQRRPQARHSSGGGLGGGLAGALGSILMGGSLGGRPRSRRAQHRGLGGGGNLGGSSDPFGGASRGSRRRSMGGRGGGGFKRGGSGGGSFKR